MLAAMIISIPMFFQEPPPPAPVIFSVPSGALPWPVPDFGQTSPVITFPSPSHSSTYTAITAEITDNVDSITSPITDVDADLEAAMLDMPDPTGGLDTVMMIDPVTGSSTSMADMINDSVTKVTTPFTYSKSFIQFGQTLVTEYPALLNIWVMLVTMLVNTALHFLVIFIRSLWSFASWLANLIYKIIMLIAELIPG